MKKLDRYEFIWKAIQKHGYKDDLREVNYINKKTKVKIICPSHGEFWITPNNYIQGHRCKKCANLETSKRQTFTFEKFLEQVNEKFGYYPVEYDKSTYNGKHSEMRMYCKIHGEFWSTPYKHLHSWNGCPICGSEHSHKDKQRNTIEKFIEIGSAIFIDENNNPLYDYSKSKQPKNNKDRSIIVICKKHGDFMTSYNAHIGHKKGCPICGIERMYNKYNEIKLKAALEFEEKAKLVHNDNGIPIYHYHKVNYNGSYKDVCIICSKHGEFWQTPANHLSGHGCPMCAIEYRTQKNRMTYEEFMNKISKIHIDYKGELLYDYSKVNFIDMNTEICVICKKHGEFFIKPSIHLYAKCGCKKCNFSKIENEIDSLLLSHNITYDYEKQFDWLGRKTIDFFLPQYNIAIECQGLQHFKPIKWYGGYEGFKKTIERDELKRKLCEEHGIKLLYYSNLGIDYPYKVFENKDELLKEILNKNV